VGLNFQFHELWIIREIILAVNSQNYSSQFEN